MFAHYFSYLVFFIAYIFIIYIIKRQNKYSYDLEQIGNFYENRLEIKTDIFSLVVVYDKIYSAIEKDKAFYLLFESHIICIDKIVFLKEGELANFSRFIKGKIVFK